MPAMPKATVRLLALLVDRVPIVHEHRCDTLDGFPDRGARAPAAQPRSEAFPFPHRSKNPCARLVDCDAGLDVQSDVGGAIGKHRDLEVDNPVPGASIIGDDYVRLTENGPQACEQPPCV